MSFISIYEIEQLKTEVNRLKHELWQKARTDEVNSLRNEVRTLTEGYSGLVNDLQRCRGQLTDIMDAAIEAEQTGEKFSTCLERKPWR